VYLARAGIKGLVLLGSTGESVHVSDAERAEVIGGVRRGLATAGFGSAYPLVAGVATQSIAAAARQLDDARHAGAQWGMVLAPGYFASAVAQEGIARWYEAVASRSALPILLCVLPFAELFPCGRPHPPGRRSCIFRSTTSAGRS
jgi:2-keto-3-deoxy-L-rhamnonate aldolase